MSALDRVQTICPGTLLTVWDLMERLHTDQYWLVVSRLSGIAVAARVQAENEVSAQYKEVQVTPTLQMAYKICAASNCREAGALCLRIAKDIKRKTTHSQLAVYVGGFLDLLRSEMAKQYVVVIHEDEARHYEKDHLFGENVSKAFPSAAMNIREAGSCLACRRYNAAVYHLMCVAEIGLRVLAWDRRIKPKYKGKEFPLEMAMWGQLIDLLENEVENIKKAWKSRSPVKAEAEKFYGGALQEIRIFNSWRTETMHARGELCSPEDALALYGHVSRFMKALASKISEETRTPVIWKGAKP